MPPVLGHGLDPRNIDKAVAVCRAFNSAHHIPLLKAACAGQVAVTFLSSRLSRPNIYALGKEKRPSLILVGDDEGRTTGPMGWVATAQMLQWAKGALVHATGGDQQSYTLAVTMAEQLGRLLLVETSSDAAEAWVTELQKVGVFTVLLLPTGDGVHPVEPEREPAV